MLSQTWLASGTGISRPGLAQHSKNQSANSRSKSWGYIDQEGSLVIPVNYGDADYFSEGLARVCGVQPRYGVNDQEPKFIDRNGNIKISSDNLDQWDTGEYIVDQLLRLPLTNGVATSQALLTKKFEIPRYFDSFSNGRALIRIGKTVRYIDKSGKILSPSYLIGDSFSDDRAIVQLDSKTIAIIDTDFHIVSTGLTNSWHFGFSEGLIGVTKEPPIADSFGYIDKYGRVAIPLKFQNGTSFHEGRAFVEKEKSWSEWFLVDKSGNRIGTSRYDGARWFSEGLSPVCKQKKWGFVDLNGNQAIPFQFDEVGEFREGLALVYSAETKKYGFVNRSGRVQIPFKFTGCDGGFYDGLAAVSVTVKVGMRDSTKYGYIDKSGAWAIAPKFDNAKHFSEGRAAVQLIDTTRPAVSSR